MNIETYLIEECQELIENPEELKEWKEKVSTLGLIGQESLAAEGKSPIPFPAMNLEQKNVYKMVLAQECKVEDYSKDTIPMRVLSLIALARQEDYFIYFSYRPD